MYNYILSAGLTVVSRPVSAVKGNIHEAGTRKEAYPGLNNWMRDVFVAHEKGLISKQDMLDLFMLVKNAAIANYKANVINETVQVAETVVDEVAELKAAMRLMAAQVQALQKDAKVQKDSYEQLAKAVVLENRTGIKNKVYQEVVSKVGI